MVLNRPSASQMASIFIFASVFAVVGYLLGGVIVDHLREKRLKELAGAVVRSAEIIVTSGVRTLNEATRGGQIECTPADLQSLRMKVYRRSWVKDLRFVAKDGSVICSAFEQTLEFDDRAASRPTEFPMRNGDFSLLRMEQIDGFALGLLGRTAIHGSPLAVIDISPEALDILPARLRAHGDVSLDIVKGPNIGRCTPADVDTSGWISFTVVSAVYPLSATLRLDPVALAGWETAPRWRITAITTIIGLAFGLLWARMLGERGPIADLDRAIARGEFRPFYQPLFDLKTGRIVGCEALARWMRSDGTTTSPATFIPLAESSGRIETMTWQILAVALREIGPRLRRMPHFKVSVNITPKHLLARDFIENLRRVAADANLASGQVVLEITERDQLPDLTEAARVVGELHELGFRVAMDDVGVGHNGLSQMKMLGADTIKIDKFFVDTVTRDASALSIVEMLVRLAHDLKMTVVAEGIESSDQISALLRCGVDEGQGYIISPPLPFAKFNRLVDDNLRANATDAIPLEWPAQVA